MNLIMEMPSYLHYRLPVPAKETMPVTDLMLIALIILAFMLVVQAVMLPFQLKYGAEKGRIAIIGAVGIITVIGVIIVKGAKAVFNIDIVKVLDTLPAVSMGMLILAAAVIAIILFLISLKISISIMNKKEF